MFRGDLQAMFAELSDIIGVRQEDGTSLLAIRAGKDRDLLSLMTKNLDFLNSTKGTLQDIEGILPADIKRRLMMGVVFQANLLEPAVLEGEALAATEGPAPGMNEGGLTFEGRLRGVGARPVPMIQAIKNNGLSAEERRLRNMTAARTAAATANQRMRMQEGEQATVAALGALPNNTQPRNAKKARTGGLDALAVAASEELARTNGDAEPIVADEEDEAALAAALAAPLAAPLAALEEDASASSGGARRRLPKYKKKTRAKNNPKTRNLFKRATRRRVKRV
jgi:hypothetical protein